jgi:hypothetical protein
MRNFNARNRMDGGRGELAPPASDHVDVRIEVGEPDWPSFSIRIYYECD